MYAAVITALPVTSLSVQGGKMYDSVLLLGHVAEPSAQRDTNKPFVLQATPPHCNLLVVEQGSSWATNQSRVQL